MSLVWRVLCHAQGWYLSFFDYRRISAVQLFGVVRFVRSAYDNTGITKHLLVLANFRINYLTTGRG